MSNNGRGYIEYGTMVEAALRTVVRDVLIDVMEHGVIDPHHFYITFGTHAAGVDIADYLRGRYPEDMIIVLQHQFWDLEVDDESFGVTLSFNDKHERLRIPFKAIKVFADPGVEFGLQFTIAANEGAADGDEAGDSENRPQLLNSPHRVRAVPDHDSSEDRPDDGTAGAEIVSLDRFRKK